MRVNSELLFVDIVKIFNYIYNTARNNHFFVILPLPCYDTTAAVFLLYAIAILRRLPGADYI